MLKGELNRFLMNPLGNILVDAFEDAKIADFGCLKISSAYQSATSYKSSVSYGTLRWSAPEHMVLEAPPLNWCSDVYALGMCILQVRF